MYEHDEILKKIRKNVIGSKIAHSLEGSGKEEDGIHVDISLNEYDCIQLSSYVGGKKKGYHVKIFLEDDAIEKMWQIISAKKEKERLSLEQRRLHAEQSFYEMRGIARDVTISDKERLEKLLATLNM